LDGLFSPKAPPPLPPPKKNIYKVKNVPLAVIERPFYLEDPVHQIKQLLEDGILSPNSRMVHRNIYAPSTVTGPGETEILFPNLDWKAIWRNTEVLKNNKIKETMFSVGKTLNTRFLILKKG
jgi:hypothetical protein